MMIPFLFIANLMLARASTPSPAVFRFHLLSEPHSLDPQLGTAASGNYVVQNLFRGLMTYDSEAGVKPWGASHCERRKLELDCTLSKEHLWSDGKPVTASDYVLSFRRLIDPHNRSPQVELIMALKNAAKIWAGGHPVTDLGVVAVNDHVVRFLFDRLDVDFEYKLIHPALSPLRSDHFPDKAHAGELFTTGPYRVQQWLPGNRLVLESNPFYPGTTRPKVEALFIESDDTALRLYDQGTLSFDRRLPTEQIIVYRNRPDFHEVPFARFDYLGFSPALRDFPKLRRALSLSMDFNNFREIFDTRGRAGCPSLPENLFNAPICLNYEVSEAQSLYKQQPWPDSVPKTIGFSQMGGDDVKRTMEWFQGQWQHHLGVLLNLNSQEQVVYLGTLHTSPPPVFRKGISLQRPSCLAALENFAPDAPENFIGLKSKKYAETLEKLRQETNPKVAKKLCSEAIHVLIDENWLIPLGQIQYAILAKPQFTGWDLNPLNQLDLANLHLAK